MGGVVTKIKEIVIEPIFNLLKATFQGVINFFKNATRMICDKIFTQRQFEFSSEKDQEVTRQLIEEQRRKKAGHRLKMTCKCCNQYLVDYVFDCGDMACTKCNGSTCKFECFACNEIIRLREYMEYDRSLIC